LEVYENGNKLNYLPQSDSLERKSPNKFFCVNRNKF